MKTLWENEFLFSLVRDFPRSPLQINRFLEGDAELISLDNGMVVAITVDNIVEEIEQGLYKDPFLIGWMTVVVNLSDLAAVGAEPVGLLLLHSLPSNISSAFLQALQRGIREASEACGTFVLGGDTNKAASLQVGGAAVGLIRDDKLILRKGCKVGDRLYTTSHLGIGNAFAFAALFLSDHPNPILYRPMPRVKEGQLVRRYGSACIDTSDGLFPALANLMSINQIGFRIEKYWDQLMTDQLGQFARLAGIECWYFLAGPHGEFELLFTLPPINEKEFLMEAECIGWCPLLLGEVTEEKTCHYYPDGRSVKFEPAAIANLFDEANGEPERYFDNLKKINFL